MRAVMLYLTLGLMGADPGQSGWRPLPDGSGLEYIIQIDPSKREDLRQWDVQFDIPPDLEQVRTVRVHFGTQTLPRQNLPRLLSSEPKPLKPAPIDPTVPEKQTAFLQPKGEPSPRVKSPSEVAPPPAEKPEPWLPLAVALAGSLGGNVYLGWIAWEARRRYRGLSRRGDQDEASEDESQEFDVFESDEPERTI